MSKDNNTNIFAQYNKELIERNLSVDNCKECHDLISCDKGLVCANPNPTTDDCMIISTDFNK